MLGVGGAAAIAEEDDLVAVSRRLQAHRDQPRERLAQGVAGGAEHLFVFVHLRGEKGVQVHGLQFTPGLPTNL